MADPLARTRLADDPWPHHQRHSSPAGAGEFPGRSRCPPMSTVSLRETLRRQASRSTNRIHSLPQLVLMPHSRCNCRCLMCDIWQANAMKRELSREDIEQQMGSLRNLHVQRIVLSGGEALMHSNLWLLCELLRELNNDLQITLLSTGLLLKTFARAVVKWCDEVIVSLDGSREVHD